MRYWLRTPSVALMTPLLLSSAIALAQQKSSAPPMTLAQATKIACGAAAQLRADAGKKDVLPLLEAYFSISPDFIAQLDPSCQIGDDEGVALSLKAYDFAFCASAKTLASAAADEEQGLHICAASEEFTESAVMLKKFEADVPKCDFTPDDAQRKRASYRTAMCLAVDTSLSDISSEMSDEEHSDNIELIADLLGSAAATVAPPEAPSAPIWSLAAYHGRSKAPTRRLFHVRFHVPARFLRGGTRSADLVTD